MSGFLSKAGRVLASPGAILLYVWAIAALTIILTGMAIGENNKGKPQESKKYLIASIVIQCVSIATFGFVMFYVIVMKKTGLSFFTDPQLLVN